jgi:hypothetical protein
MPAIALTRRRAQLELLAHACERRELVRVAQPPWAEQAAVEARFLALEPDGVLLDWPARGPANVPISGAAVDLQFDLLGDRFTCRVTTRGRAWSLDSVRGQVAAWKLSLPLRLERDKQRREVRIHFTGPEPTEALCTPITRPDQSFTAELVELSARRITLLAPATLAAQAGNTLWITFTWPERPERFEFIARVARGAIDRPEQLVCEICPAEDPADCTRQLERIEQLVAGHTPAAAACPGSARGGGQC